MDIRKLDHVQLAIPPDGESVARSFYAGILRLSEVPKPDALRARGGVWFRGMETYIHLGIDPEFTPQSKGHPAFIVKDVDLAARDVTDAGYPISWDDTLPGRRRFYTQDPFGNRLEFLQDGHGIRCALSYTRQLRLGAHIRPDHARVPQHSETISFFLLIFPETTRSP
jgi:catechol 2,3-dioxygenase-like lactoylglutathione lyase family enzyme